MQRNVIYQGKILTLVTLDNRWEVVEHADAICVLALRGDEVLGVRQHRPAIGRDTWELPAGLLGPGETPIEAARRELAEEAQLTGTLTLLTQSYTSPGFCQEKLYLFEATELSATSGRPDDGEEVTVEWRKLRKTWHEIACGILATSAPTTLGLAIALARRGGYERPVQPRGA